MARQGRPGEHPDMTTVLVTGARGNTGREVAAQLAAHADVNVRGGTTDPDALSAEGVTPVHFDWSDPSGWEAALDGVDALYLARPDVEAAPQNVQELTRAAAHAETIVLLSEMGAEDMAPETWVRRVEDAFLAAREDGWTIVRPTWFAQVLTDERFFLGTIRDQHVFSMPSAGAGISFIDTRDIAAVAVAALLDTSHWGRTYTLSGPEALTLEEVAERISDAVSAQVSYLQTEIPEAIAELRDSGGEAWLVEVVTDLYARVEAGRFGAVTDVVEHVTGAAPRTLDAFIAEHAARWQR
jgi:uncharacterized protein YbjT (DUF2867 family)